MKKIFYKNTEYFVGALNYSYILDGQKKQIPIKITEKLNFC